MRRGVAGRKMGILEWFREGPMGYNIWSFWLGVKATCFHGRKHSAGTPVGYDMTGKDKEVNDSAGQQDSHRILMKLEGWI